MKFFWLLPLLVLSPSPLHAQTDSVVSSITLLPPTNSHTRVITQADRETIKALLQLAPQIRNDAGTLKKVAVALARLGATDVAFSMTRDKSAQTEVREMAALRSIFAGTTQNASRWISLLPTSRRSQPQLQLARRLLLEKQPNKAIAILRQIPSALDFFSPSNPAGFQKVQAQSEVALSFAEAGDKEEARRRFDLLDKWFLDLAQRDKEMKQQVEFGRGGLTFNRLLAGLPLPAHQIVGQGQPSITYALSFYLDKGQEAPAREILNLLPPVEAVDVLSNVDPIEEGEVNALRQKLLREGLVKVPEDKRAPFVERESRALALNGDATNGIKLIEEFLSSPARDKAENQLRLSVLSDPRSAAKLPPEIRESWGTQLLAKLQLQRQQEKRQPENTGLLNATLTEIVEVAVALNQNQTAQNALYEREKLPVEDYQTEEDKRIQAELFASDWSRAGNPQRAELWRRKASKVNRATGNLARVQNLINSRRSQEAAALLPRLSESEWEQVDEQDLYSIVASLHSYKVGTIQNQPPAWIRNLSSPSQKADVLAWWAYFLAPWDNMSWARIGEKMP